ncbi:MAG TPA: DUF4389 domain-containing protein [Hyphomicrobium sp.]|nr:DUF4389 domain-containing protein [Hyphomicrobium sp.]
MDPANDPIERPTTNPAGERRSSFGDSAIWLRGLYMLLLAIAFGVGQTLLCLTAIAQFLWLLFAGEANGQLTRFGVTLARWLADTARFLTCASEVKPFPWSSWPSVTE